MYGERAVEEYLGTPLNLSLVLLANALAFLVGVSFYVNSEPSLREIPTFLYPLFGDSPTAIALVTLALATLLANLGRPVSDAPTNRPLAYLQTLAFVWLVKYGLWTVVALNLRLDLYLGFSGAALWDYWGIVLTHAAFLIEAAALPHFGRTTRGALGFALVALLMNDVYDYGFGFHPPLRYEPGLVLPVVTVGLSLFSVWLAARVFAPLEEAPTSG